MANIHHCIWCGKPCEGSLEHILPESLGCPSNFVLSDGVCTRCNNGLAAVDHALLHEFEIIAYIYGLGRKDGRPPAINTWAPVAATVGPGGPEMHFNAGPEPIHALGKKLPAAGAANGISNFKSMVEGKIGRATFDQKFGAHPKFVRAIYKVAFGSLAYFLGLKAACDTKYDPLREFVTRGKGSFRTLMLERLDVRRHCFGPPWTYPGSEFPVVGMTILGASFIADLDPQQKGLAHIRATAPNEERLAVLPPTLTARRTHVTCP